MIPLLIVLLVAGIVAISRAQTAPVPAGENVRLTAHHAHSWFQYFGNHKFANRWGVHAEIQIRRAEFADEWQQLLLRTGIDYYVTNNLRLTFGYAYIETFPYGDFPVARAFPEHRIWQNLLFTVPVGRFTFQHRIRPEQRFIGNPSTGEFANGRFEWRFRYMLRVQMPLKGKTLDPNELYVAFQNEVFVNGGTDVRYNLFDQNRLYGGIGYNLGKWGRVETAYMNQLVQLRNLRPDGRLPVESNHTWVVAWFCNVNFFTPKSAP